MLTFRPISYHDADLRAFKYSSAASSKREGTICKIASTSSLNIVMATPWSGKTTALPTIHVSGGTLYMKDVFFPIFKEDPDPESVSATIDAGDYCIGMALIPGNEFEIHYSVTEKGYATFPKFTKGGKVCLGSNGKFTTLGGTNDTALVVGVCLGTFNGKYARIRVI